jgi:hypothetical protein
MTPQLGAASFADGSGDYNPIEFIARQVLAGAAIATLVQIKAVNGNTVNVQPLVNQVDGLGNATPHGVVNGIKWIQLQSGPSGIIIPPAVNDIGLAVFADRDISSVVAGVGPANPGSARRNDYADGIYVTALPGLNAVPTQFIEFLANAGGINMSSPGQITLTAEGKTWMFGSAGLTLSNGVVNETHVHAQGDDSHGDTEEDTGGPQNP